MATSWCSAAALVVAAFVVAEPLAAQRGGGRGRPEEVQNRVAVHAADVTLAPAPGEPAPDAANCDFVRAAAAQGQLAMLYVYDGAVEQELRQQFEHTLFGTDAMGLRLRCFQVGRVDIGKDEGLRARYGKKAPVFLVFGKDGKLVGEVAMPGCKASGSALQQALEKAGNQVVKPSLGAVADAFADCLRDLEQLLQQRKLLQDRLGRTEGDDAAAKQKRAALAQELKKLEEEQRAIEARENELVQKHHLPAPPENATRLGRRPGRGGR